MSFPAVIGYLRGLAVSGEFKSVVDRQ